MADLEEKCHDLTLPPDTARSAGDPTDSSSDAGDDTDVNDGETGNNTFQVNADDNPSFPARKRRRSDDASASRW